MSLLNTLKEQKLPAEWKTVPIDHVLTDIQYGTSEPTDENGDTAVIGMKDIQNGKILTDNLSYVKLSDNEKRRYLLKRGDLLLNRTNSYDLVGKVGVFDSENEVAFASYLVRLFVNKSRANSYFVNYCLNSPLTQNLLRKIATKAISQANINPTEFKKYCYIPLPPVFEQCVIVDLLSTWDAAIEKTEQLIAAKERMFKVLLDKLVHHNREKDWVQIRLGNVFRERIETDREDLPLLSITREEGVINRDETNRKDTSSEDKSKYLRICKGDIGYNTMRMWQGVSAVSTLEGIISPAYTVCIPDKKMINADYASYLFKHPWVIHQFYRYSQGLTSDTWNLKYHHFAEIKIWLPPLKKQKAIAEELLLASKELQLMKKLCDAFKEQKQGLLKKLLTGEIRLKDKSNLRKGA